MPCVNDNFRTLLSQLSNGRSTDSFSREKISRLRMTSCNFHLAIGIGASDSHSVSVSPFFAAIKPTRTWQVFAHTFVPSRSNYKLFHLSGGFLILFFASLFFIVGPLSDAPANLVYLTKCGFPGSSSFYSTVHVSFDCAFFLKVERRSLYAAVMTMREGCKNASPFHLTT